MKDRFASMGLVDATPTARRLLALHFGCKLSWRELMVATGAGKVPSTVQQIAHGRIKRIAGWKEVRVEEFYSKKLGRADPEDVIEEFEGAYGFGPRFAVLVYDGDRWQAMDVVDSLEKARDCLKVRLFEIRENNMGGKMDAYIFKMTDD